MWGDIMQEPRVWIVSADHWPRALLRAELIERGFDAVGFETSKDVLAALLLPRSRPPALVVVDLHEQVVEAKLLERLLRAGIPIVAIADATRTMDEEIRQLGWAASLRRPVSIGAIAETVERLTGGHRTWPAPPAAPNY
jgi:DNA-binding response OmpR family regulator